VTVELVELAEPSLAICPRATAAWAPSRARSLIMSQGRLSQLDQLDCPGFTSSSRALPLSICSPSQASSSGQLRRLFRHILARQFHLYRRHFLYRCCPPLSSIPSPLPARPRLSVSASSRANACSATCSASSRDCRFGDGFSGELPTRAASSAASRAAFFFRQLLEEAATSASASACDSLFDHLAANRGHFAAHTSGGLTRALGSRPGAPWRASANLLQMRLDSSRSNLLPLLHQETLARRQLLLGLLELAAQLFRLLPWLWPHVWPASSASF